MPNIENLATFFGNNREYSRAIAAEYGNGGSLVQIALPGSKFVVELFVGEGANGFHCYMASFKNTQLRNDERFQGVSFTSLK